MVKITKYTLRILVTLIGISLLSLSLFLLLTDYENFVYLVLEGAGKLHKINEFKSTYLPDSKYEFIKYLSISIVLLFFILIYSTYLLVEKKMLDLLFYVKSGFKTQVLQISRKNWILFFLVFLLTSFIKIYYYFEQVITNDEAFTFISYVNQGFAASLTYYNLTNNHILHSLLCNVFNYLPFSPIYTLRIASFLAGSFTLFVIYVFFNRLLSSKAAFFAFVFFAFAPPSIQYGFLARGYGLLILFAVIATFSLFELIKTSSNKKKNGFIFILASALGFYSIPVYIYIFVSHLVFYAIYSLSNDRNLIYSRLKDLIVAGALVSLLVILFFSPVILVSGLDSLIGNEHVKALTLSEFANIMPGFLSNYYQWIFGGNTIVIYLATLLIPLGLYYAYKEERNLFILLLSFFIVPFVLTTFQRIFSYNRLYIFNLVFIALSMGLAFEFLIKKFRVKEQFSNLALYLSTLVLALLMLFSLNKHCKKQNTRNKLAYNFADKIETRSSVFSTSGARYYTFLKFKAQFLDKKEIELFRYAFDESYKYDYISEIKLKNENFVESSKFNYALIYSDEFIRLYRIKDGSEKPNSD